MLIAQFFNRNPNFVVFEGVQGHLEGLGERRDQHGHGLGPGVDHDHVIL